MSRILLMTLMITFCFGIVQSQQPGTAKNQEINDLKKEIQQLRIMLDSLRNQAPFSQEEELDQLEERMEKRLLELENKIDAISRATAPVALNPRITAFINFAARADDKEVFDASGNARIDNLAYLRGAEFDFRAAVDPYADAIAILAIEKEIGGEFAADPEEAYGLIKRLPILEAAPLGMKLKIGKFRAPFGVNNKLHLHDVPWTTRPLAVTRYLGSEQGEFFEAGYSPVGIDFDFFLPSPLPSTTLEMNIDLINAGELGLSQGYAGTQPAYLAHLNFAKDWSNEHLLIIGASVYQENGSNTTTLFGGDLTYKWAPSELRDSRSFVAGGEIFSGRNTYVDPVSNISVTNNPFGWFAYTQYQLSWWVYAGVRYDWIEEPFDEQFKTSSVAGYLNYYTTEFLRFRIGYEHKMSDIPALDNVNSGIFEVNFVFGSHPTEPYWVNR